MCNLICDLEEYFAILQGTYVEGMKEEVVLSPAHALSLIASGEGKLLCKFFDPVIHDKVILITLFIIKKDFILK